MKKIFLVAIAFISLQAIAQETPKKKPQGDKANKMMSLSPEEMATLQTKKMTLHLNLTPSQQEEIHQLNLENANKRKAMMEARKAKKESGEQSKPTADQRYAMANKKLDHQIAMKAKMKSILNEAQFEKWENAQKKMAMRKQEGMKKRKNKNSKKEIREKSTN